MADGDCRDSAATKAVVEISSGTGNSASGGNSDDGWRGQGGGVCYLYCFDCST